MKRLAILSLAAALLAAPLITQPAPALEWTVVSIDRDSYFRVDASPAVIDFGAANKGTSSQVVLLDLTNNEAVDVTVLALQSSDAQVRIVSAVPPSSLSLEGEVIPTVLNPGAKLTLSLQYVNAAREGAITGSLSVLTLGGGSEATTLGFTATSAGTPADTPDPLNKPAGEWFFGSCFLRTLGRP